jgi:ABC-type branched-subunit amino acid transport system ATPase component
MLAGKQPVSNSAGSLELRGLCKSFGGIVATDSVDLSVASGELRALIGPNGAGKSTLFRLISGQHRPDSGTITMNGRQVTRMHAFQRARLGLATKWQNQGTFSDLTVASNLAVAARTRRRWPAADEQTAAVVEMVGLESALDRRAGDLSHGEQQLLEIAMALSSGPSILLLDEPAAGLSKQETTRTASIVRDIARGGVTVLVTEHDMAFVRELEAPVTVLHQGRVFAEGSLEDIENHAEVRRIYLGSAA